VDSGDPGSEAITVLPLHVTLHPPARLVMKIDVRHSQQIPTAKASSNHNIVNCIAALMDLDLKSLKSPKRGNPCCCRKPELARSDLIPGNAN
jgi:hypothetical protein